MSRGDTAGAEAQKTPQHVPLAGQSTCDVVLITAPWAATNGPSIQLSILKPIVEKLGLKCHCSYGNLDFLKYLTLDYYDKFLEYLPLGEWLFSRLVFPEKSNQMTPEYLDYINQNYLKHFLSENTIEDHNESVQPEKLLMDLFGENYEDLILSIKRDVVPDYVEYMTQSIRDYRPRVIGFTTTFNQNVPSLAIARALKQELPNVTIIFGGGNCEGSMGPALLRAFPYIDFVISGEGEVAFPKLLDARLRMENDLDVLANIRGLSYRRGGSVCINGIAESPDLETVPFLDCSDYYEQASNLRKNGVVVPTGPIFFECSRGCWWGQHSHCTFCGLNGLTMRFRTKSPERIFDEVMYLSKKHRVVEFQATDNILNPILFAELLPRLRETGIDFQFYFEVKSTMTKKHVRLLSECGVRRLQPGIESLSTHVLQLMRKGTTMLQNVQALKWFEEFHIRPDWNFLYGFPNEQREDYERIESLIPKIYHLPPPSTELNRIELHRFSPNFDFADGFGFKNIRPIRDYFYIYDLSEKTLMDLAYSFDYELEGIEEFLPNAARINKLIREWRRKYDETPKGSKLTYRRGADFVEILDFRGQNTKRMLLTGLSMDIFLHCDVVRTSKEVLQVVRARGVSLLEERLEALIYELCLRNMMVEEDGKYLSLPTAINPVVEKTSEIKGHGLVRPSNLNVIHDA